MECSLEALARVSRRCLPRHPPRRRLPGRRTRPPSGTSPPASRSPQVAAAAEGAALITAAIDIPAPREDRLDGDERLRGDEAHHHQPVVCRTLQGNEHGAWDVREQVTKGNLFVPTIHNVVRDDYQPYTLIRFRKAGGDLKDRAGRVAAGAAERRPGHAGDLRQPRRRQHRRSGFPGARGPDARTRPRCWSTCGGNA